MNSLKEQYDQLASVFSQTRKKHLWPELQNYLARLKAGDRILDMGAGSGRLYRGLPEGVAYVGVDISSGMLGEARKDYRQAAFFEVDILDSDSLDKFGKFDYIFIIAVAHHFDEKQLKQLFYSAQKCLKLDGTIILSCWKLLGRKHFYLHASQILSKIKRANWRLIKIPFFVSNGLKITKTIDRTCYAYSVEKLKTVALKAGLKIIAIKQDNLNIWLECQKSFPSVMPAQAGI